MVLDNTLENNEETILLNISGKCILKLSNSEKKELESNIQKNYIEFLKESIEISYFSEKIENSFFLPFATVKI